MSKQSSKQQSPDENKSRPFGKSFRITMISNNSFATDLNEADRASLTGVSKFQIPFPLLKREPDVQAAAHRHRHVENGNSTTWRIKIFLN
jgi:hypothetical protein